MPKTLSSLKSVNETVTTVANSSLAAIYLWFNDLGFSYIPQLVDGLGLGSM